MLNCMQDGAYPIFDLSSHVLDQPIDEVGVRLDLPQQILVLPHHFNDLPSDRPVLLHQLHGPVIKGVAL